MGERRSRYEATVEPDGRIRTLVEQLPDGPPRAIPPESPEGLDILGAGQDIVYRFDEERRLRDLPYPEILEAMHQEVQLTLQKVLRGELLDEPEVAPILKRLLVDIEAAATAFRRTGGDEQAAT